MIALSKLLITGVITSDTPKIVTDSILLSHRVNNVIELNNLRVSRVHKYPEDYEYEKIGNFINPHEKWDKVQLLKAWLFIQEFMGSRISVKWNLDYIGPQTNERPYSLNVCMLYRICLEWSLPLNYNTKLKHMTNMIRISLVSPKILRVFICEKIKTNYDDAKDETSIMSRLSLIRDKLVKLREPSTNCEAIALAASLYKQDITYSSCPIVDYYSKILLGSYNDPKLLTIVNKNSKLLDLTETFNPVFPVEYYTRYDLKKFSERVGFTNILLNPAMYNNLQLNYITENFCLGWQYNMSRDTTYISWYEVDKRNDLICFGDNVNGFTPFVPEELIEMYSYYRYMVHPINTDEVLSERCVTTLKNITMNKYPTLYNIVYEIESGGSKDNVIWLKSLNNEDLQYIKNVLMKIIELGMYCRGWKGGDDPWPLEKRPYDSDLTDPLVTMAFWPVYEEYKKKLGKKLLDLPMYKYMCGSWKKVVDPKDGLSIYARICMIKDNPNVYACIRMSSNVLIHTAYKYMSDLGLKAPYNIDRLDYIC